MIDDEGYVLGIDGGGSQTRCVVADLSGRVLTKGTAGPSNPLTVGVEAAGKAIANSVEAAINKCGSVVHRFRVACLGVAGVDRPYSREALRREVMALDIAERLLVVPDAAVALAGATGCGVGVVVISGTGSIAYGVNVEGETARAGGWGWMVDDEGSAYDIGRRAMTTALMAYDGRGEQTTLADKVKAELGLEDLSELIDRLYVSGMKSHEVAALSLVVAEAAAEGDEVAIRILREAGVQLGRAAGAVIRRLRLRGRFTVAETGGVFQLGEPICATFEETVRKVAPDCTIAPARFDPAVGSVLLALRELGVEVDEPLMRRVEASLRVIGR